MSFSLDAASARTYERIRPPGKWKTVTENLVRFAALRTANPLLQLQTSYTILGHNLDELMDFMHLNAAWRTTYVHLHPAMNAGFPPEWRVDVDSPKYKQIIFTVVEFAKRTGIALDPIHELLPYDTNAAHA